ncbi:5-formyltetrahydrofolate cyclo-ligase [Jeotgalicoccus coquinae]|uniref:5-formyltetrahydrofolate cyclo-ligase n=1 Tax=Jeotgalicoccus coquinae TaxID=709509 RepID=A0A6V7R9K6_9STAP|nr:5-formyltetrahydrofolate cyclo-ligase [Jeotgalicoccus coquinae]MBB6422869.1 5-formyltetrahydrofolate cyclo-ligase [Jeotgalicoccus coquinae]GGE12526.1 5-formyltetrahydrofolate cyclo-ligase [Jeotgalicoccus coquinae]CAD2073833.1 5-formyltetrahydrofolate cyclo-ligase family protein [Jeotgalicoccus coquinae]
MSKKELRQNMISILKSMDTDAKNAAADNITAHAKDYIQARGFKSTGIVLPMKIEYDTWKLIDELLAADIEVYAPQCHYEDKSMTFHRLTSRDEVTLDEKNIPIPNPDAPVNNDVELLIVPGLIFSPEGYRIGYGGGFYDRFLTNFNGSTASLIFSEQIGETIVMDHDLPVDVLITDKEIFNVKEVRKNEE